MTQLKDAGVELDAQVCAPSSDPPLTMSFPSGVSFYRAQADEIANARDVHKDEVSGRPSI
jgi:hypothetical protein